MNISIKTVFLIKPYMKRFNLGKQDGGLFFLYAAASEKGPMKRKARVGLRNFICHSFYVSCVTAAGIVCSLTTTLIANLSNNPISFVISSGGNGYAVRTIDS